MSSNLNMLDSLTWLFTPIHFGGCWSQTDKWHVDQTRIHPEAWSPEYKVRFCPIKAIALICDWEIKKCCVKLLSFWGGLLQSIIVTIADWLMNNTFMYSLMCVCCFWHYSMQTTFNSVYQTFNSVTFKQSTKIDNESGNYSGILYITIICPQGKQGLHCGVKLRKGEGGPFYPKKNKQSVHGW